MGKTNSVFGAIRQHTSKICGEGIPGAGGEYTQCCGKGWNSEFICFPLFDAIWRKETDYGDE
jgi:hypothetical protein